MAEVTARASAWNDAGAYRRFSTWLSASVILIGAGVMVGWAFDISILTTAVPGYASMKPNTALGLMLLATVILLGQDGRSASSRRAAQTIAVLPVAIGGLTLVEYALNRSLGLERLQIFTDGRMAPATAIVMLLFGLALIGVENRWKRMAFLMSHAAGVITLLALCGYLFDAKNLYAIGPYTSMALHTTIAFIMVMVALLTAHPTEGPMGIFMSNTIGGSVVRKLWPITLPGPIVLAYVRWLGQRAGLYDTSFGLAIMVVTAVVLLNIVTFRIARELIASDVKRVEAEEALRRSNEGLRGDLSRRMSELKDSEERLTMALQAAETGTWDVDILTGVVTCNEKLQQIFGEPGPLRRWTIEEFIGHMVEEDRQRVREEIAAGYASGKIAIAYRVRWPDGSLHHVESLGKVFYGDAHEPVRMIGTAHDITERRDLEIRAEEQAKELKIRSDETERMNRLIVDRETTMIKLKARIAELETKS